MSLLVFSHCTLGTNPAAVRAAADLLSKPDPAAGGCTEWGQGASLSLGVYCVFSEQALSYI